MKLVKLEANVLHDSGEDDGDTGDIDKIQHLYIIGHEELLSTEGLRVGLIYMILREQPAPYLSHGDQCKQQTFVLAESAIPW